MGLVQRRKPRIPKSPEFDDSQVGDVGLSLPTAPIGVNLQRKRWPLTVAAQNLDASLQVVLG